MCRLCLNDSGNENDASNFNFVLAELALFERQTCHLYERIDPVQEEHFSNRHANPFDASAIRKGQGLWRGVSDERRQELFDDLNTASWVI